MGVLEKNSIPYSTQAIIFSSACVWQERKWQLQLITANVCLIRIALLPMWANVSYTFLAANAPAIVCRQHKVLIICQLRQWLHNRPISTNTCDGM